MNSIGHTSEHEKLSVETALKRNLMLYLKGCFLGIPLLVIAGYIKSYQDMKMTGCTNWDEDTSSRVFVQDAGDWRVFAIGVLAIAALVLDRFMALRN